MRRIKVLWNSAEEREIYIYIYRGLLVLDGEREREKDLVYVEFSSAANFKF